MPRVYELPTHLQVEDVLIAGLTARQLVRLMIGASLAYGVWDQAGWQAQDVRLAVAVVLAVIGVLFALLGCAVGVRESFRDPARALSTAAASGASV